MPDQHPSFDFGLNRRAACAKQAARRDRTAARRSRRAAHNPVIDLPAAQEILDLGPDQRRLLGTLLWQFSQQARTKADACWGGGKGMMAGYWRTASSCARHLAHVVAQDLHLDVGPVRNRARTDACRGKAAGDAVARSVRADVRNPVLGLPAGQSVLDLGPQQRRALGILLRLLARQARAEAENRWRIGDGMLAAYWRVAAVYAKHLAAVIDSRSTKGPSAGVQRRAS